MNRLANRVRRNGDFATLERLAEEHGLSMDVEPGGRLGHPRAVFSRGDARVWVPIATSPKGGINLAVVRSRALRRLKQFGLIEERA